MLKELFDGRGILQIFEDGGFAGRGDIDIADFDDAVDDAVAQIDGGNVLVSYTLEIDGNDAFADDDSPVGKSVFCVTVTFHGG